ncbi:MAG: HAD family hydrolase [Pseudobdellovibrio sp.]
MNTLMNYKPFTQDIWKTIESTLAALKSEKQQLFAAFDADGTLWDTDLGENFFNYQIDNNLVETPPDAFNHYLEMKKINDDPRQAYVWLAQINKGKTLTQVREWALQAFKEIKPSPIFDDQKKLIELLLKNNVQIYIVTASIKWAVEPGALALGLSNDNVIGVETSLENNIITDKPVFPITYRMGKVEALLKQTQNNKPFLASGNSMGDYELLEAATHCRLAVSASSRDDKLFKTENELATIAKSKNWMQHRFI